MKKLAVILFFLFNSLLATCQSCPVMLEENEYATINGCKKLIKHVSEVNSNLDWTEWQKQYLISDTQSCDFSAYVIIYRKYKNEKIIEKTQFISGCDDCEEKPCGIWIYYDKFGKVKKKIKKCDCDLKQFDFKK